MKKTKQMLFLIMCIFSLIVFCVCAAAEETSGNRLYPIREDGLYGYINGQGEVVVEPKYEIAAACDDYGYAVAKEPDGDETGWCVLLDAKGSEIVRAPMIRKNKISYHLTFGEGEKREGLFSPSTGSLIYYDGMILDEPADDPESTRVLVSPDNDHYGYLDRTTGEMAIPVQYDVVCTDWTQLSNTGGYQFIAYDFTCFHEGYAVVGQITGEQEIRMWLIDEQGKEIPLPGEPVTEVCEGKLNIWKDGQWYVCTVDGQIISDGYDEIRSYQNGYCGAINWYPDEPAEDEEWRYPEFAMLNADGKEIYRHSNFVGHEKFCGLEVENGYCVIIEGSVGEFTEIYNMEQGLVCTVPNYVELTDADRELMVVADWRLSEILCRMDGTPLFLLPYDAHANGTWTDYFGEDHPEPFYEDGLWLLCADNKEGKRRYGYLNEEGTWAVEPRFIWAEAFKHGMAWCTDEQGYDRYIDTQGRTVWKSGKPRDTEEEREILDAAGIWYGTDEKNVTHWLIMGIQDWQQCIYARSQDGVYREIDNTQREDFIRKFASPGITRARLEENGWKKLEEPLREISSVWHRQHEEDCDDYLCLFADGTYEEVYKPDKKAYVMVIADYGRIDGQQMISEMPGKTLGSNPEMLQENGLLTCVAPGTADRTYHRFPEKTWEDYCSHEDYAEE